MAEIRIWKTQFGAAILTDDAVGFGFFERKDFPGIIERLESGESLNSVVGVWSGSVFPYAKIRRVKLSAWARQVILVSNSFVSEELDIAFQSLPQAEEFQAELLARLGPEWAAKNRNRFGWVVYLVLATLISFSTCCLGISGFATVSPSKDAKPGAAEAHWVILAVSATLLLGSVFWLWRLLRPRSKTLPPPPSE